MANFFENLRIAIQLKKTALEFWFHVIFHIVFIGGHRFWNKGGVYTGVCLKKKFVAAFGGQNFFSTGVWKFFFLRGVLLVDRGVILQKNDKK